MRLISLIASITVLAACNSEPETPALKYDKYASSYALIQAEMWDVACNDCHKAGTSFATQSDLVLTSDVSYEQLINRKPQNLAAQEDGLVLLGNDGLESLYKSFLWEKINAPNQEHYYTDHPAYGSLMPLGGDPLTNGELEFIRQWILSGAPKEGNVVDLDILEDISRFENVAFSPLEVPEQGIQFHVEPFDVQPNSEREFFVYKKLNNPHPVYISAVEISMRPGSHHFIFYNFPEAFPQSLYPVEDKMRDIYNDDGSENLPNMFHMLHHQFVVGTQWPRLTYSFPKGVALEVPANSGFDLNGHYANRTEETMLGEIYGNLDTIPRSEVSNIAYVLNLNNQDFRLPRNEKTTIVKKYNFNQDRNIFQLWSHAHEHMTQFSVYIEGGERNEELIYVSYDWEHPPILQLDPPILLKAGESLRLEATYDNWEDRDLSFGLRSTDEMMILFGAYY